MTTFFEASQARLIIKMKLINYSWYKSASVITDDDGFAVLIGVKKINNSIRKAIPNVFNGVVIRTALET